MDKNVSTEIKQKLKADAEQWAQKQIQEQNTNSAPNSIPQAPETEQHKSLPVGTAVTPQVAQQPHSNGTKVSVEASEASVSSTAVASSDSQALSVANDDDVCTSGAQQSFKPPIKQALLPTPNTAACLVVAATPLLACNVDEVTSSSSNNKELDLDHSSVMSCSTTTSCGAMTDNSSFMQSSQESSVGGMGMSAMSDYSDPREDYEEEREERMNLKTTNEREVETSSGSNDASPGRQIFNVY